jgi:hypothetical protein
MEILDSKFRVRGVKDLRVVDASAFPRLPGSSQSFLQLNFLKRPLIIFSRSSGPKAMRKVAECCCGADKKLSV